MNADAGAQVQALAHALWVWEAAELELGDLAIVAGDPIAADMIAKVAYWRSGGRVLALVRGHVDGVARYAIETLDPADQAATLQRLGVAVAAAPSTAAAICDDNAAVLELVLEAIPAQGRIVLVTGTSQRATVDFYNNVHRKGCRIVAVPATPGQMNDEPWRLQAAAHVERAVRVLGLRPSFAGPIQ